MNRQSERTNSRRKPRFHRLSVLNLRRQADIELEDAQDNDYHFHTPVRKL